MLTIIAHVDIESLGDGSALVLNLDCGILECRAGHVSKWLVPRSRIDLFTPLILRRTVKLLLRDVETIIPHAWQGWELDPGFQTTCPGSFSHLERGVINGGSFEASPSTFSLSGI